jgi:hypoxanthine phosphoribosyltransferase
MISAHVYVYFLKMTKILQIRTSSYNLLFKRDQSANVVILSCDLDIVPRIGRIVTLTT